MMVLTTSDVVRVMGVWVRRADAGLARTAAHNAASELSRHQAARRDDAQALRDLNQLRPMTRAQ